MLCAGTTSGERCGGDYKLTAYEIEHDSSHEYLGCFPDSRFRVLTDQEPYFTGHMTNEVSRVLSHVIHVGVESLPRADPTRHMSYGMRLGLFSLRYPTCLAPFIPPHELSSRRSTFRRCVFLTAARMGTP